MKKVMFVMAVAGMFAFAACNNNATEAEAETSETMEAVETEIVEEVTDTNAVENMVEETVEVATEANAQ